MIRHDLSITPDERAESEWDRLRPYRPPPACVMSGDVLASHRSVLDAVSARPEIVLLAAGLEFSVDTANALPLRVRDGRRIELSPAGLADAQGTITRVRLAVELALWQRLLGPQMGASEAVAAALLACRAAGIDVRSRRRGVTPPGEFEAPWLRSLFALLGTDPFATDRVLAILPDCVHRLLELSGFAHSDVGDVDYARVRAILDRAVEVAAPVEFLLTTGGDNRLRIDPQRGLNHYGCSPRPRPWAITFASCTATSISEPAYAHAEMLRQRLMSAALSADLPACFQSAIERIKREIVTLCGGEPGTEVILTTSGTDAELCVLQLSMPKPSSRLLNVVVAPAETGSSVGVSAGGRHFDSQTALGVAVLKGQRLEGLSEGQIGVEGVSVRNSDGSIRSAAEVDADVETAVDRAVGDGMRVVLHAIDTSKTGLVAPSLEAIARVQARHGDAVNVVMDACQLRLDGRVLQEYQRRGFIILVTGSKFFTGPPFAGALLVPAFVASRARAARWMLPGLASYSTRHDWPLDWPTRHQALSGLRNLGLLLRWEAALWEMRIFHQVPRDRARTTLERFSRTIIGAIERRPLLSLLPLRAIARAIPEDDGWDTLPTIFTFSVSHTNGGRMSLSELRNVYEWLNRDLSDCLRDTVSRREQALASRRCHIGQPVTVGQVDGTDLSALRIAGGARLVSGVMFDPGLGETEEERLASELRDALLVFEKIDLITRHFGTIAERLGAHTG